MPQNRYGIIPWKTYCPISPNYFELDAPLYQNFRMRKYEHVQFYKVVLGNEFAKSCSISMGNHVAKHIRFNNEPILLPFELQHVPIRSNDQFIRKVIMSDHINSLRTNRKVGQGAHNDLMAKKIRDQNYKINFEDLSVIAIKYSLPESILLDNYLTEDAPRIGEVTDTIEFRDLASINLTRSFDLFLLDLINKINSSPDRLLSNKFLTFKNLIWRKAPSWLKGFVKKIRRIFNILRDGCKRLFAILRNES